MFGLLFYSRKQFYRIIQICIFRNWQHTFRRHRSRNTWAKYKPISSSKSIQNLSIFLIWMSIATCQHIVAGRHDNFPNTHTHAYQIKKRQDINIRNPHINKKTPSCYVDGHRRKPFLRNFSSVVFPFQLIFFNYSQYN